MLHYKMARRYHVKMATRFTATVWLELGLAQTCEFKLQAAYSFVILTTLSTCCTFLNRKNGRHARLGMSINKKPLKHYFLRHSGFFYGAERIMLPDHYGLPLQLHNKVFKFNSMKN